MQKHRNLYPGVLLLALALTAASHAGAFELIHSVESTPLKDQESSGTCWSFAVTSFLETEAIRLGGEAIPLSAMFYVKPTYLRKAETFVESGGESYFTPGDLSFSVLHAYETLGAIPESVYAGRTEADWQHDHVEMDNLLGAMVSSVGASGYGHIKDGPWRQAVAATLDAYLGAPPQNFEFRGKSYTPRTFADTFVRVDPMAYVEVTSFSHHPFNQMIELEIPANWSHGKYLNVPLETFKTLIDDALENGFSLAWDGDSTESGFGSETTGIAELPWSLERQTVTQQVRQAAYEDELTTDDHNMHLIGIARDPEGRRFYQLKNSEGSNAEGGYLYMSENYLQLKTVSLLVHRDALPAALQQVASQSQR